MFISYKLIKYLDDKNVYEYELTDSKFGTVFGEIAGGVMVWKSVIHEYGKRNLNIAANLAVALVWWQKHSSHLSIKDIIDYNKIHNPHFLQYEEDIQKYLLLL
jgi:hypothetical protein